MAGKLRNAIDQWISDKFPPSGGPGWWGRVKARYNEYKTLLDAIPPERRWLMYAEAPPLILYGWIYVLTGTEWCKTMVSLLASTENLDPSSLVADAIRQSLNHPAVHEISQVFGAAVTEPVLTLLEHQMTNPSSDPKEFARSFHGIMVGLNVAGGLADTVIEAATGGQVEGAGRMLQSVYWSLGLGFLGWQTLAPLLESGLQPGLDRYYKRLARPARFSASEMRDLYALGKIPKEALQDAARDLGWRDADIDTWLALSFRNLTQGDIFDAFHQGRMTEAQAVTRLRALGYDPADIPLLFQLNPPTETKTERETSAATARTAYRDGLVSRAELTALLKAARYSDQEIALIIGIEDTKRTVTNREITVSQMRQAWEENVVSTPEARSWLAKAGFDLPEVDTLIATWEAQAVPEFRKVNLGTITAAYVEAILSRAAARAKLIAVGLAPGDADLELDLTEKRNPAAFGHLPPPVARKLTVSNLADILAAGLINADQMRERLVSIGYTAEDAGLIAQATAKLLLPFVRELPQPSIERAYVAGVLTRQGAAAELVRIRLTAESAEIVLKTLDAEQAAAAKASQEVKARILSPGQMEDLLIAGLLSGPDMLERLTLAGYSETDARLLVDRATSLALPVNRPLNLSLLERAYVAGVFNRAEAFQRLIDADYTPDDAEAYLKTIDAELLENLPPGEIQSLRTPTIDALTRALQNGIISEAEFISRCIEIGFAPEDAALYFALALRQERKAIKTLTPAQLVNAYGAGFLPWSDALSRLTQTGYGDPDAVLLLRMEKDRIENTEAWNSLLDGSLGPFDTLAQLVSAHYADQDIYNAFAALPASDLSAMGLTLSDLQRLLASLPGGI